MNEIALPNAASGPAGRGTLQIHPSLKCNLSCPHCYSVSGPQARLELDPATVCEVISDAAELGYEVVSVSGGEPLLYRGLADVLSYAKSLGLRTTVTTNGFFIGQERLRQLRELVDVLAISLDGPPELHNELRGSARAFSQLEAGLENVRQTGIPFGFIHTVTRRNWEHLLWVAEFAAAQGARLLQLHPLELSGRAAQELAGVAVPDDVLEKVYLLAFALKAKYGESMLVQLDLLYRDHLREEPELVYAAEAASGAGQCGAPQALGLLVLEPDGALVPVSYGFARRYQVCNVKEARLRAAWPGFLTNSYQAFKQLCHQVWEELSAPDAALLSNWHEVIVARSHRQVACGASAGN